MGCSASTQNTQHAIASEERLPGLRAKRDPPPTETQATGELSLGRREAPFSGAAVEAPLDLGVRVCTRNLLQWASFSPAMLVLDDFLSSEECDALVALASGGAPARPARCTLRPV